MATRAIWILAALLGACSSGQTNGASGTDLPVSSGPMALATATTSSAPAANFGPPWWSSLAPAPGAAAACVDPVLVVQANQPVRLGAAGAVRVFDAAEPSTPVYSVDLTAAPFSKTIAGREYYVTEPVVVDGALVRIEMGSGVLEPGHTYSVTIDAGVFLDEAGNALASVTADLWSFTTGALPAPSDAHFTVRADGTGDTCTIQGAIDAAPKDTPVTIDVMSGTYHEILHATMLSALTLRGEDRDSTVIAYANNDTLQRGGGTASRGLFTVENTPKFRLENLTLENTTPEGGSQAEALSVQAGVRAIVRNVLLESTQDTLMMNGRAYFQGTTLLGNVDYVWGTGAAYFDDCELRTVGRAGYTVQARNLPTSPGFVFVNSRLTSDAGLSGHYLARIEADRFPNSRVAFVDCELGSHIAPVGWLVTGDDSATDLRFEEYGSHDPAGNPVDTSQRHPASRQLTAEEADALRDPGGVLGWDPNE